MHALARQRSADDWVNQVRSALPFCARLSSLRRTFAPEICARLLPAQKATRGPMQTCTLESDNGPKIDGRAKRAEPFDAVTRGDVGGGDDDANGADQLESDGCERANVCSRSVNYGSRASAAFNQMYFRCCR